MSNYYKIQGDNTEYEILNQNYSSISSDAVEVKFDGFDYNMINFFNCQDSCLKSLHIPEGIRYVYCDRNVLHELILPNSIDTLSCDDNPNLKEIYVPSGNIKLIWLSHYTNITNLNELIEKGVEISYQS